MLSELLSLQSLKAMAEVQQKPHAPLATADAAVEVSSLVRLLIHGRRMFRTSGIGRR